jgi:hypothetical protein
MHPPLLSGPNHVALNGDEYHCADAVRRRPPTREQPDSAFLVPRIYHKVTRRNFALRTFAIITEVLRLPMVEVLSVEIAAPAAQVLDSCGL